MMSVKSTTTIPIPVDQDGYVLLKCPNCGTYFKITPEDLHDDGVLQIFCPSCGLAGENYLTEDVHELAVAMAHNMAVDMIHEQLRKLKGRFGGNVKFSTTAPKHVPEKSICSGFDEMTIVRFSCCQRNAKIKPLLKVTGCYCPFCGVKNYEVE